MDERILLIFSACIEVFIAYQLFNHFLFRRNSVRTKLILASIVLILILAITSMLKVFLFNTLMSLLLYAIYIEIIFKCKWWQALFWPIVFALLGMVSEIATSFGVSFAFNVTIENTMLMTWYKLIVYFISKSVLCILVIVIISAFHSKKEVGSGRTPLYLISFPVLAILNEHLLVRMALQLHLSREMMAVSMIIGIGLILAGFALIILYSRGLQKNQLEKKLMIKFSLLSH